ncbi:type II toxin-antitoxin system VapB family antitoxin [Actinoplanes teichomyceticus]|uniref:type II toxin-antitoxin system VapB family antitoxin n=1 Tax=Actinoplanes teichomyceticus TaxID=1867 RepID=UPI001EF381CA|nr:type II toxin-antitoxin system VapB family antitoxin [Actinoplanes teichomyceticus]
MEANPPIARISIDDRALIEAAKILGTTDAAETVNAALREVVAIHERVAAVERLAGMGAADDFDDFLDKRSYRQ